MGSFNMRKAAIAFGNQDRNVFHAIKIGKKFVATNPLNSRISTWGNMLREATFAIADSLRHGENDHQYR